VSDDVNSTSSWSMSWDDEGNATDDERGDIPPLHLPRNKVLVARVFGEPSPGSRVPRVTFLCASSSGALVTRTEGGSPLWSDPGRDQETAFGAATQSVPADPGGECRAMFDGWHLIEWFNCTRYTYHRGRLTGTAEYYGPFDAGINDAYGFVSHVDVNAGSPDARRLIEVQSWRLLDDSPELLRPVALELRNSL
jgi:hypothetical protein